MHKVIFTFSNQKLHLRPLSPTRKGSTKPFLIKKRSFYQSNPLYRAKRSSILIGRMYKGKLKDLSRSGQCSIDISDF
jgi:hypothetical protein